MRLVRTLAALSVGSLLVLGCVSSRGLSSEEKEKLKAYILESEPQDVGTKLDVNFENKIRLLGAKIEPAEAKPGTEVKITYYWKCDDPLDDGWLLFTHVRDPQLDKRDNLDSVGPLRENIDPGGSGPPKQKLPPSKWERGKVYIDEQTYKVPDWVKAPELEVITGIWKGNNRLRIVTGPNDGDQGALAGKIKTGMAAPSPVPAHHTEIPSVTAYKLAQNDKIVIDGKGEDKAWGGAPVLGPFVVAGSGEPQAASPVQGTAKLAWDDANLYVLFDVKEKNIVGMFDEKTKEKDKTFWSVKGQPQLWMRDTVEMMIDPDGDGDAKDYYELQINPQNKVFHTQYDAQRVPLTEPNGPWGHEEWDPKLKSAVVVDGTVDKDDEDKGYVVEAAIPWAAFTKAQSHPPKPGDTWRMNFYAMKANGGVAWSATMGDFHNASRFGRVTWQLPGVPGAVPGVPPGVDPATGASLGIRPGQGAPILRHITRPSTSVTP